MSQKRRSTIIIDLSKDTLNVPSRADTINLDTEGPHVGVPLFDKLLSVEELATAVGLAPKTIRNWVSRREIPHVQIGGKTRFRKRSIEAWLSRKELKACQ